MESSLLWLLWEISANAICTVLLSYQIASLHTHWGYLFCMIRFMHSCFCCFFYLHFDRISPNMRIRGRRPSCCPGWNILILWHSGRHLKVWIHTNTQQVTHPLKQDTLNSLGHEIITLLQGRLGSVALFFQLTASCVLSWSTVVEETCSRGSGSVKLHRSALMM